MNDDKNEADDTISNSNQTKATSPSKSPVPFDPIVFEPPKRKNTPNTNIVPLSQPRQSSRKKLVRVPKKKHRTPRRWSAKEHGVFLRGLEIYGRDWEAISKMDGIMDRTKQLVGSHAQRHFINLWRRNEPLPLKVQQSGTGYTLSGKPLDPNSAAVQRRKSSKTPQTLRALHADNAKALKQLKQKTPRVSYRRRKRGKRRYKTTQYDDDVKQDPEERKKRKKRNKACKMVYSTYCSEEGITIPTIRNTVRKLKVFKTSTVKTGKQPMYQSHRKRVHGKIHPRVNPNNHKQKIGISYSLPMEVEGFEPGSGAMQNLAPLFIRPKYLGVVPQHDLDVTFLSHFHKIWFTEYRRLKKQTDDEVTKTHFEMLHMPPIDPQNTGQKCIINQHKQEMKQREFKHKKKRSDKEEMSDDDDDDMTMNKENNDSSDGEDIEMNTEQTCDTGNVSIIYDKNDKPQYHFDSHHIPLSYNSLAMPPITKSLAKKRRFHVVYFNFKSKGVIVVHKVLKKWGLVNGELRRKLMLEYGGQYKKIKNLHEIFKIAKQNKIKTGIFMIHFRYHPMIGIQTFHGDYAHVLNEANVVLFVRFQDAQGYISKADRAQNARIREAQKQGKQLIVQVPKDSIAHSVHKRDKLKHYEHKKRNKRRAQLVKKWYSTSRCLLHEIDDELRITANVKSAFYSVARRKCGGEWSQRTTKCSSGWKAVKDADKLWKRKLDKGWRVAHKNHKYKRKPTRRQLRRHIKHQKNTNHNKKRKRVNAKKRKRARNQGRDILNEHEPLLKKRKINIENTKNNRSSRARSVRSHPRSFQLRSRSRSRGREDDKHRGNNPQKGMFKGLEQLKHIGNTEITQSTIDQCKRSVDVIYKMKREQEENISNATLKTPSPLPPNTSTSSTQNVLNAAGLMLSPYDIQQWIALHQMQPQPFMLTSAALSNPFVANNVTQVQPISAFPVLPDIKMMNPVVNSTFVNNITANTESAQNDTIHTVEQTNKQKEDRTEKELKKRSSKKKKRKKKRKKKKKKEMVDVVLEIKRNKRINVKIELIVGYDVFTKQLSQSQQTLMNTILQHFSLHLQKYLKTKNDPNQPFYCIHTRDTFHLPLSFTEQKQKVKDREFTATTYYIPHNVTPCKSYAKWYAHHHWYKEQKQLSPKRRRKRMEYRNTSKMIHISDKEQSDHYIDGHDEESETEYVQQMDRNTKPTDDMNKNIKVAEDDSNDVEMKEASKSNEKEEEDEMMEDDVCDDDDRYRDHEAKSFKRWMELRLRGSTRETMVSGKRSIWVGGVAYHDLFTEEELKHIEKVLDKIQIRSNHRKYKRYTSQSTLKRSSKSGVLVRTKHFFGARYLWHPSEFKKEGKDKTIGAGLRVDVDDKPDELFELCEQKLVKYGIIPANWIQGIAFNMYHDGTEGLAPHFDDEVRFDRPVITIRLFSDARIAFGTELYGTTNGTVSIPLPRGCVLSLQKDSFVADGIKHTIRPCDMYQKSAAIILRRFQQKALEEAKQLHLQRLESGYYDREDGEQVDATGNVKKTKRKAPIVYGGRGGNIHKRIVVEDNEYTTADGFCVPDDYVEYEEKKRSNRFPDYYDLTGDDNDIEVTEYRNVGANNRNNNNSNSDTSVCDLTGDIEMSDNKHHYATQSAPVSVFNMEEVYKMILSQSQIYGANGGTQ